MKLPKFRMAQVLPQMKLPQMPEKLPPLEDLLKALPPMDPKAAMSIPGLNVKLPPAGDVMKFMKQAGNVLNNIPKPANMPSLQVGRAGRLSLKPPGGVCRGSCVCALLLLTACVMPPPSA